MRIKLNKKTNEITSLYFDNDKKNRKNKKKNSSELNHYFFVFMRDINKKITTRLFQCHPRRWYFDVRQSQVHHR